MHTPSHAAQAAQPGGQAALLLMMLLSDKCGMMSVCYCCFCMCEFIVAGLQRPAAKGAHSLVAWVGCIPAHTQHTHQQR